MSEKIKGRLRACLPMLVALMVVQACNNKKKEKPSFKAVLGMQYIEADRYFLNGLSFNEQGYELEPSWKMHLLSDDSLMIYHPQAKVFYNYPIYHDHDSVFNIARHWMRVKHVSKDSLIFQLLSVEEKVISHEFSNAYMKFYSYDYIHKHRINVDSLRKPRAADTLFIRAKSLIANRNPATKDFVFAARQPVQLHSRVNEITVTKKKENPDPLDILHVSPADEYLYPEFNIEIHKAYKDFNYSFKAFVDIHGRIHLGNFMVSEEFRDSRKKVLEGIIQVYLERFLLIRPGSTLGIPHASEITLNVKGISN